jgi:hypothetical protein
VSGRQDVMAVWDNADALVAAYQLADLQKLREPTAPFGVSLDEAHEFLVQERLDVPARVDMLSRCQWNVGFALQPSV